MASKATQIISLLASKATWETLLLTAPLSLVAPKGAGGFSACRLGWFFIDDAFPQAPRSSKVWALEFRARNTTTLKKEADNTALVRGFSPPPSPHPKTSPKSQLPAGSLQGSRAP